MGKIDEVKEVLNTLRIAMSIAFGILVIIIGSIIKRYDDKKIDVFFWSGWLASFIIMLSIVLIMIKIVQRTKEIKDL